MKLKLYLSMLVLIVNLINVNAQEPGSVNYDFKDGTIITNGQSDDGLLTLSGTYNHHGTTYGLDMKSDAVIKIAVSGSCTVKFLGSKHSSLAMSGQTSNGIALEPDQQSTKVTNDLIDTYQFTYYGFADTLIFTAIGDGSDVYLPSIAIIPLNPPVGYDFRDGTIITNGQSDDGSLKLSGSYNHHGTTYGLDMKLNATITIAVSGSCRVRFLGSKHSSLSMSGSTSGGTALEPTEQSTKIINDLSDTYEFVYFGFADTLKFTATGGGSDVYLPLLEVIPLEPPVAYDLRDGTIIGNGQSDDGTLKLSGNYNHHGTTYGLDMKVDSKVKIGVEGSCTVRFLGSKHSSLSMSGATSDGTALVPAEQSTKVVNDLIDTYEFVYDGDADTLIFTATGGGSDVYLPLVEVIPGAVKKEEWKQKTGTITISDIEISYTAGDNSSANPTISVSAGTVISATPESASISIDLGGNDLSTFTPTLTGDIESVDLSNEAIEITFLDSTSNPKTYKIMVTDSSEEVEVQPGKTYSYNFADGSQMPQDTEIKYTTFFTSDRLVEMNSNGGKEFWYHDTSHGVVIYDENSFHINVAGNATITFITCTYSADEAVFTLTNENDEVLGEIAAENNGGDDAFAVSYTYTGSAGVVKATLTSGGAVYIHGLVIENAAAIEPSNGLTDVWDFGAEQLDTSMYNNNLDEDIINSWYDGSIEVGSSGNVLPGFTAGVLTWVGGGNDRLRTTNTNLTRYDENISKASGTEYTGRIYVNSGAATGRYLSLTLSEDDEVSIIALTQNGSGLINFEYVAAPDAQTDKVEVGPEIDTFNFIAKESGTYHIFDEQDKPSYYRICRKDASYNTLAGTVDVSAAIGIPSGFEIVFTNEAGKSWNSVVSDSTYSLDLPVGYTYQLSLANANGYIISNGNSLEIHDTTTTHDITIQRVELYTVSGNITGLKEGISNLVLSYIPDTAENKIFIPEPVINVDNASYSVELEPNCRYMITANGVNDSYLLVDSIMIGMADTTVAIDFIPKPVYKIDISGGGLNEEQVAKLSLTFTNLFEEGYEYSFTSVDNIELRDGTYSIAFDGLDDYPVELGLTSNLKVEGGPTNKDLEFMQVKNWSFDDKVISNETPTYKGLLFSGSVSNEIAKGHLSAKPEATIQVPVNPGQKIIVTFYYSADFSIDGGPSWSTSSGSTSKLEYAEYSYPGNESGFATITIGSGTGTTYLPNISIDEIVDYKSMIYVGTDKEYKTINEALSAISKMVRNNSERVTVMIDPGNYEEMLVISQANVTLKNAAAAPNIDLMNKGVDISENAVRITSYYGHGYNYYSMGNDQKWNTDVLRVNKENGYLSYENKGSGTTNGSYWNATIVISANDFIAEGIIFENSFNQYISKKESEDVVEMWESGSKGLRPTDYGNTEVQNRSFVERAAAIALVGGDKIILNKCRVVGRQDSYYGGENSRVVMYKGAMMGAVDYLFGAMVATFYQTELVMNVSDASNDASYLTAAQQSSGRGYLMYECTITSAEPGIETASEYRAKPGYFGRPWKANTSEVVFYNTTVETSNYPGSEGISLISPEGWKNTLGGESTLMYEYGTKEKSGEDNQSSRASWSTVLTEPILNDGIEITPYNFTKGSDGWDPLPDLIAGDPSVGIKQSRSELPVKIYSNGSRIYISNLQTTAMVEIYSITGSLVKSFEARVDTDINFSHGFWIVNVVTEQGQKTAKVITQ